MGNLCAGTRKEPECEGGQNLVEQAFSSIWEYTISEKLRSELELMHQLIVRTWIMEMELLCFKLSKERVTPTYSDGKEMLKFIKQRWEK